MCNCASPCSCDSGIELPFINGSPGTNGLFGGYSAKWKFDTSTSSSPSAGYLHFNNANLSLATSIYIHENNSSLQDHTNFLNAITNGKIRVFKEYDSSNVWYGQVTGVVAESATVIRLDVTLIQNNANFILNDDVVVSLVEDGVQGPAGNDGIDAEGGSQVIDLTYNGPTTNTILGDILISELTVPANTLSNDKDVLEFYASLFVENSGSVGAFLKLSYGKLGGIIDPNEIFFNGLNIALKQVSVEYRIEGKLYRVSSNNYSLHLSIAEKRLAIGTVLDSIPSNSVLPVGIDMVRTASRLQFTADHSEVNKLQIILAGESTGTFKLYNFMIKHTKYEA